ncbi:OprD family outer membrane porin, partial [Acinetobacter baumannii]
VGLVGSEMCIRDRIGDVSLNGLRFMTRYAKGEDIDLLQYGDQRFKEDSLEFDLGYKIPEGKLKGLGMRARFSHYRNDMPTNMTCLLYTSPSPRDQQIHL